MANNTVPMSEMFKACHDVMCRELAMMHYAKITELALDHLGVPIKSISWHRQIEDVREKMLLAGQFGTFYIGQPSCLGGLKWWFENAQRRMIHPTEGIRIAGHASHGVGGAFEALMRDEEMTKKTNAPIERVRKGRARGLVLQAHVTGWFGEKWPEFYRPPDNKGLWKQSCNHDFKLAVGDKVFEIDVSGPRSNGTFGNPGGGKRVADFHLICEIVGKNVWWRSVVEGEKFTKDISPDFDGVWPERMIVWLNCERDGIDYKEIKAQLSQALLAAA
jgi:hypothetical protein